MTALIRNKAWRHVISRGHEIKKLFVLAQHRNGTVAAPESVASQEREAALRNISILPC